MKRCFDDLPFLSPGRDSNDEAPHKRSQGRERAVAHAGVRVLIPHAEDANQWEGIKIGHRIG